MKLSSMENVLRKMNNVRGVTFYDYGAETPAEKKALRIAIYGALTEGLAVGVTHGRYKLTNKGRHMLDEIMDAKKVAL